MKTVDFDLEVLSKMHIRDVKYVDTGLMETSSYLITFRDYTKSRTNGKKGRMIMPRETFLDMAELVYDLLIIHPTRVKPKKKKRKLQNT